MSKHMTLALPTMGNDTYWRYFPTRGMTSEEPTTRWEQEIFDILVSSFGFSEQSDLREYDVEQYGHIVDKYHFVDGNRHAEVTVFDEHGTWVHVRVSCNGKVAYELNREMTDIIWRYNNARKDD